MKKGRSEEITNLLKEISVGKKDNMDALMPLLYNELYDIAQRLLLKERNDHTLSPTALINEAYIKLIDQNRVNWIDKSHFLGISALIMKRILLNYAKQRVALKRGGGNFVITFNEDVYSHHIYADDFLELEIALERLHEENPRYAEVVEYKYFGGMTNEEIAEVLKISVTSVKRDWRFSRAWLANQLSNFKKKKIIE